MKPIAESLQSIREAVADAEKALIEREQYSETARDQRRASDEMIAYFVERAFVQMLVLLEAHQLEHARLAVQQLQTRAKKDYVETKWGSDDVYLVWTEQIRFYLDALEVSFGTSSGATITKDLLDVLRATQWVITNERCFGRKPDKEEDVHLRIEAVLQCLFPGHVQHKPSVSKTIKTFEPDTGLPTLRTFVEYKFLSERAAVQRIADEILADTRGFEYPGWDRLVFVIYETHRIRSEADWNSFLRDCGAGKNIRAVVISGEPRPVVTPPATRRSNFKRIKSRTAYGQK